MKNIAIVIAVSSYDIPGNDLPGCTRDGESIKLLLDLSNRFSDVHYVNGRLSGSEAKSDIADFLHKFSGTPIGEVFFYFSGHGEYAENEFHYLFSNYHPTRRKQSSLENVDLDKMVRQLSPEMFVKVVDACHSGTPYIKDPFSLEHHIKSVSASAFKNICFMFSSHQNEFSLQDNDLSYFTRSILSAVKTHKDGAIKYKNVTDYVSDHFDMSNTQSPFFIDQSSLTEIFLNVDESIRTALSQYVTDIPEDSGLKQVALQRETSLVDMLKEEAATFCTKEEAGIIITNSESYIHNGPFSAEINELYEVSVDAEPSKYPPQSLSIASWIEKNNEDREFFARPEYRNERHTKRVPKNNALNFLLRASNTLSSEAYEDVEEYRNVLNGYESVPSIPYKYFSVKLNPKFRNLAPEECFIAFICSRSSVRYFWAYSHYEYTDWESSRRIGKMEWATDVCSLKDEGKIKDVFNRIIREFCKFVEDPLRSKWGKLASDSSLDVSSSA